MTKIRIELTHGIVFDDEEERYHAFVQRYELAPELLPYLDSPSIFGIFPEEGTSKEDIFGLILEKIGDGRVQLAYRNSERPLLIPATDPRWWLDDEGQLVRPLLDVEKKLAIGFRVAGLEIGDGSKSVEARRRAPISSERKNEEDEKSDSCALSKPER